MTWHSTRNFVISITAGLAVRGTDTGEMTRARQPWTAYTSTKSKKPGSRPLASGWVCSQASVKCCWHWPKEHLKGHLHFHFCHFSKCDRLGEFSPSDCQLRVVMEQFLFKSPVQSRWHICSSFTNEMQSQLVSDVMRYPGLEQKQPESTQANPGFVAPSHVPYLKSLKKLSD